MSIVKIVYWQDQGMWLGYLEDYPDYMTQGETLEELKDNLKDIYQDIVQI
jgi:predicted RNase H-like HicB family nuclease